jgi:hypothetical protein
LTVKAAEKPGVIGKRPSPTPSVKRGKIEKLIKEHGSPPGVRVTAAGRVVPTSNVSPGSAQLLEGSPSIPTRDGSMSVPVPQISLLDGFVAYNMQGQLCQVHNGKLTPLDTDAWGIPKYYKFPVNSFPPSTHALSRLLDEPTAQRQPEPATVSIQSRVEALHKEMDEAKKNLNQIERQNVFANYKPPEKLAFVIRKKELILRIDNLRRELTKLLELESTGFQTVLASQTENVNTGIPSAPVLPPHFPTTSSVGPSSSFKLDRSISTRGSGASSIRGRESHAIPIVAPKTRLNPASPEFQPPKPVGGIVAPPIPLEDTISAVDMLSSQPPTKIAIPKTLSQSENVSKPKKIDQKSSSSSFNTVDFFPTAPEEHSLNRFAAVVATQTPHRQMSTVSCSAWIQPANKLIRWMAFWISSLTDQSFPKKNAVVTTLPFVSSDSKTVTIALGSMAMPWAATTC